MKSGCTHASQTTVTGPTASVTPTTTMIHTFLHDVDAAWLAAAGQAFGESGRHLTLVVVTRQGWWDPRSGTSRVWKRLRAR